MMFSSASILPVFSFSPHSLFFGKIMLSVIPPYPNSAESNFSFRISLESPGSFLNGAVFCIDEAV